MVCEVARRIVLAIYPKRIFINQQGATFDLLDYALKNEHWQLRAAARRIFLEQGSPTASQLLLEAVEEGETFEAQSAVTALGSDKKSFDKIVVETLPPELQLEYANASGNPLMFGDPLDGWWLLRGGDANRGRRVVFENSRSECLRCHTIGDRGGIAGPSLDGVASRLSERQLQEAMLVPNANVANGFGDYSAMPPMGVLLDHRELRDVMAYLKTLHQLE